MKISKFALATTLCLLLVTPDLFAQAQRVGYGKYRIHPTRLIARFTDEVPLTAQLSAAAQLNEKVTHTYPLVPGLVVLEPNTAAMSALTAPATSKNSATAVKQRINGLMATGAFKYVQPDYELTTSLTPNDARFTDGTLWGLKNTGQSGGVAGADINAEAAWNITTGSTSVIVAVIDSGIRYTHQDLAAQMWLNPGEIAGNGLDDDGDGYVDNVYGINAITGSGNPMDDNDHGTHCAGTIGAAANNGSPHVGVAWVVRLMACKFLDANGSGNTSDAIECINFAVANGARVLNNSWGGGPFQQGLLDAIVGARNQGVLFVAAAGNGGADGVGDNNDTTPSYPASYPVDNIISVAALDRANHLASFSNFGQNSVHLGAPGVAIFSSTSGANNEYKIFDGTSMAAPHVSGVAALVLAQSPGITYGALRQRILQGVVPVAALNGKTQTGGRLDALKALSTSGDNILELSVNSTGGTSVSAGSTVPVFVNVTDLTNINNATVIGSISTQANTSFLNNGVAPDIATGDGVYSANILVPSVGSSFTLTLVASAAGKVSITNAVIFAILQSPTNDAFANAVVIAPGGGTVNGTNINATLQNLEALPCDIGGGKTVWWTWTAPSNVSVSISTAGSTYDTILAVYTGSSYANLVSLDCNDDRIPEAFPSVVTSEVSFNAVAGVAYQIAVEGLGNGVVAEQGNITLSLVTTPANDQFTNRTPLSGNFAEATGYNIRATRQTGEPDHAFAGGRQSVWWTWTAPASGNASITTWGSSFDTALGVYTGNSVNALTTVASNDDEAFPVLRTSKATFAAVAGNAYHFAVDGYLYTDDFGVPAGTDVGLIALTLSLDGRSRLDKFILRPDGHYEFTLKGDSGRSYRIESSSALNSSWSIIGEAFLNGPSTVFIDPVAASNTNRFYRAVLAPLIQ